MSKEPEVFAAHTMVPVEKTRAEIDRLLRRNGATQTAIGQDTEKCVASIAFTIKGARFCIRVPFPHAAAEQIARTRWRCTLLIIKSKLEIVRLGLSSVEREFMADMLLPNGRTVENALAEALSQGMFTEKQLGSGR